jgi:hypothetical protein
MIQNYENIIRVFPRKNNATPDDEGVRFSEPCLFDKPSKVFVSCTFFEDRPKAERLAGAWLAFGSDVSIGGPAYNDRGGEFEPGLFLKRGYTITSRGCPNSCWFCDAWRREGHEMRELKIKDGFDVLDSNLLACSDNHINSVFDMLSKQKERPRFTGGFDPTRMKPWIAERLKTLKPQTVYFAYDTPDDYEPLLQTCKILSDCEILPNSSRAYKCYVLIGFQNDTFEKAEKRLNDVLRLKLMPMAMLFDKEIHRGKKDGWVGFQKQWANNHKVGKKYSEMHK